MNPQMIKRPPAQAGKTKIAPLYGILGPLVISLGMLISALSYTGVEGQAYSISNHFVSELGELGVSALGPVFNASLILGGVLDMLFLIYLAFQFSGWIRIPLAGLGFGAALCGTLVGVFPMNSLDQHIFVALGFFNLGLLVALLYSLLFLFAKNSSFPRWLALPGILNTAAFLIFNNFPSQFEEGMDFQQGMAGILSNRPDFIPLALMEWVVILGILTWFLLLGIYFTYREWCSGKPQTIGRSQSPG
jgi:hypothetical membrane protein